MRMNNIGIGHGPRNVPGAREQVPLTPFRQLDHLHTGSFQLRLQIIRTAQHCQCHLVPLPR